jgi:NADH-quinone oxidoreductase subunit E
VSALPQTKQLLSQQAYAAIEREIAKYPADQKQSAVISALAIAQAELGWISRDVMEEVARFLSMPAIAVFEVASFYTMFNLEAPGRCKITICTNLPCALSGGTRAAEHLKHRLGIGFNETTPDGNFTLREGECLGACGDAPVLLVNNTRMESFMSNDKLDALLDEFKRAG